MVKPLFDLPDRQQIRDMVLRDQQAREQSMKATTAAPAPVEEEAVAAPVVDLRTVPGPFTVALNNAVSGAASYIGEAYQSWGVLTPEQQAREQGQRREEARQAELTNRLLEEQRAAERVEIAKALNEQVPTTYVGTNVPLQSMGDRNVRELQKTAEGPPPTLTKARSGSDAFLRTLSNTVLSTAQFPGIAADSIQYMATGDEQESAYVQKLDEASKAIQAAFPGDKTRGGELFDGLAQGSGSLAGILAGGVATKALGLTTKAGSTILGVTSSGVGGYYDAKEHNATTTARYLSFYANSALGLTEQIPISRAIDRAFGEINSATGGRVAQIIASGTANSLEELIQEVGQGVGQNVIAKVLYDKERSIFEGVKDQATVAGILGLFFGGGTTALAQAMNRPASEPSQPYVPRPKPAEAAQPLEADEPPATFADAQAQLNELTKDVAETDAPAAPVLDMGGTATATMTPETRVEAPNVSMTDNLPPLIRDIVGTAPPPRDQIPDAATAAQEPATPGKSAGLFLFDATSLQVDAERFQFKAGGDQEGVTNRLKGVKRWDPAKANQLMVWQSKDGELYVVDGHQRSGLARRLVEQGLEKEIKIPGLLFRETDGFTPEKMRALAAGKNLAEGSGTLLDAAKVLKVDPALIDETMPVSDYKIRQATDLSKLADEPFRMVVNEVTDPEYGAIVGRLIPDNAEQQVAAISALNKISPSNAVEAELVVRRVLNSQMAEAADQGPGLFGDALDMPESTVVEEIKIVAKAMAELKKDKAVFARVVKNADKIESVGSTIDRAASEGVVSESDRAIILLTTQSDTPGPVRTQLLALAKDLKQGKVTAASAARQLAETIRSQPAFKTRGGDDDMPIAAMRGKRKVSVDNGTLDLFNQGAAIAAQDAGQNVKQRVEQLSLLGMEPSARQLAAAREAAGQGKLKSGKQQADATQGLFADKPDDGGFDFMVAQLDQVRAWKDSSPLKTTEQLVRAGEAEKPGFDIEMEAIASDLGIKYKDGPVKLPERINEKIATKDYPSAAYVTDVVRGSLYTETPQLADQAVAQIISRFGDVVDEGWVVNFVSYADRKVLIRLKSGVIAEIQILEPSLAYAKDKRGGHKAYSKSRKLPEGSRERLRLEKVQRDLYTPLVAALSEDWKAVLGNSGVPGNNLANTSAETGRALSATSTLSTRFQAPLTTAQASPDLQSAGRPSQTQGFGVSGVIGTTDTQNGADVNGQSLAGVTALADAQGVQLDVSENNGTISLSKIVATSKNQGAGTKVMQALVQYADRTGQRIVLSPSKDFGGSLGRLKEFYKRFGFVENKGRNKDFTTRETMIRPAQETEAIIPRQAGTFLSGEPQRPATGIAANGNLPGEEISISAMAANLVRLMNVTFRTGRIAAGKDALAQYNKKNGVIRARQRNDFSSLVHETGHALNDARSAGLDTLIGQHQGEVTQIAMRYYGAPQKLNGPGLRREGFAEFFRLYVTNPSLARQEAPQFYPAFDAWLKDNDPNLHKGLRLLAGQFKTYAETYPSMEVVKSFVKSAKTKNLWDPRDLTEVVAEESQNARPYEGRPIVGGFFDWIRRGMFDMSSKAYTALIDQNNGVRKMTYALLNVAERNNKKIDLKDSQNPLELVAKAAHSFMPAMLQMQYGTRSYGSTTHDGVALRDGISVMMGASRGGAYFNMTPERMLDAGAYLVARRAKAEWARYNAGEIPNPPVGFSEADATQAIHDFEAKYGQAFINGAKIIYQYARDLLDKELASGLITQEQYDGIKDKPDYVPLMRDVSDKNKEFGDSILTSGKASIIKRFRGSSRDIISPLDALMHRTFATEKRIAENDAIRAMARLAEKAGRGSGALVEKIPAHEIERIQVKMEEVFQKIIDDPNIDPADAAIMEGIFQASFGGDETMQIFRSTMLNERGERILTYRDGGKLQAILLGDDGIGESVFNVMRGIGHDKVPLLLDLASRPSRALRFGITKWADFLLVNYFRDQFLAPIATNVGYIPFVTGAKGMWDVVRRKKAYLDYSAAMGIMGGVSENNLHKARVAKDIEGLKQRGYVVETIDFDGFNYRSLSGLIKGWFRLTELSEAGTRVGLFSKAYKRALREGLSEYDAIQEASRIARDYMDFGRVGSKMAAANRLIPFLGANLQGLDGTIRKLGGGGAVGRKALAFMDENRTAPRLQAFVKTITAVTDGQRKGLNLTRVELNDLRNAQAMWVKMVGLAMMSAAIAFAYKDDEDYQETSEYLRQTGWIIPLGDGRIFYIPKPFEISLLGNFMERAIEYAYGDEEALGKFWDNFTGAVTPPFIPPIVSLGVGIGANKDISFGKPSEIVPGYMDRLPPEMRALSTTTEVAKKLGEAIGYPPAKIDFLIRTLFGSMGRDVSGMLDGVLNPDRAEKGVDDSFITRRFVRDATRGGMSSQDFNELANRMNGSLTQASAGYKRYMDVGDEQGAADYLAQLSDDERAYAILDRNFDTKFKRLHPIYRANQISTIVSTMRREVLAAKLKDTANDGEFIPLTAKQKRLVDDFVTDFQRRERRNALIAIGHPSWKNKKPLDPQPTIDLLREVSPDAADELERRLAKAKIYDGVAVAEAWPEMKQRLLDEGPEAILNDLIP